MKTYRDYLSRLCPVVQVGVVQYGARVVNEFRLDDFHTVEEVVAAAKNIDQRGGEETRTALAISEARYSGVFVCYSLTFTNCASLFTMEAYLLYGIKMYIFIYKKIIGTLSYIFFLSRRIVSPYPTIVRYNLSIAMHW